MKEVITVTLAVNGVFNAGLLPQNQLLFTRSERGIIGDCRPVQRLCARFEEVLRHGLKERWFGVSPRVATFWPVVIKISHKEAIDYINR